MSFSVLDYIFAVIILIFALSALIKGFINEFFGKAAVLLGILGGVLFYADIAKLFIDKVSNSFVRNLIGFIAVFILVFLILKLIGLLISKIFQVSILKSLDKILGFIFGCLEGAAIVGFIIFIIQIQPFFNSARLLGDSYFYSIFSKIISSPEFKDVTKNV